MQRRKTNKFRCEQQSCHIYMNMQDHGWDIKIDLACTTNSNILVFDRDVGEESEMGGNKVAFHVEFQWQISCSFSNEVADLSFITFSNQIIIEMNVIFMDASN